MNDNNHGMIAVYEMSFVSQDGLGQIRTFYFILLLLFVCSTCKPVWRWQKRVGSEKDNNPHVRSIFEHFFMMMEEKHRPPQNPFLNHLVINKIVSYTNRLSELKSLRLVSSQWNQLIAKKLLKSSIVTIKTQQEMDLYVKHFNYSIPHPNFHWKATGVDLSDKLIQAVLPVAEELHISKGLNTSEDLLEILKRGKNLQTLSFNEVYIEREDGALENENKVSTDFIADNLTRLEVTACDKDDNFPWNAVLPVLPQLHILHAQLQSTSQVTNLLESMLEHQVKLSEFSCFLVDMSEEHLHLLSCLEMPLRMLDISLSSTVTNRSVEGLLSSKTCEKLENLKIFKESDCGHKNYFSFPKIVTLSSLEFLGDPVAKIFKTIDTSCPNLQSLNLSEVSCKDVMSQSFQHFKLNSLCIEECFFPTNVLLKLSATFPNLKKLCLFLNDENIGTIFQKFECLEELTILGTEISDDGLSGGRHHHGKEPGNNRAFVGDAKKLRVLNLYPQPLPGITDASIYHGLKFVSELTSFSAPETAISDKGLRSLQRAKPNLVKLYAKVSIDPLTGENFLRSTKYQVL